MSGLSRKCAVPSRATVMVVTRSWMIAAPLGALSRRPERAVAGGGSPREAMCSRMSEVWKRPGPAAEASGFGPEPEGEEEAARDEEPAARDEGDGARDEGDGARDEGDGERDEGARRGG